MGKLPLKEELSLFDIFDAWFDEATQIGGDRNPWGEKIDLHGHKNEREYIAGYADGVFDVQLSEKQLDKILEARKNYLDETRTTGQYGLAWDHLKNELDEYCGHSPVEKAN